MSATPVGPSKPYNYSYLEFLQQTSALTPVRSSGAWIKQAARQGNTGRYMEQQTVDC